jgi:hypothetical protein
MSATIDAIDMPDRLSAGAAFAIASLPLLAVAARR